MRFFKLSLIALLILALFTPPLSAASSTEQPFNLITSPLPISLSGPPGSTLTTDIRIKNGSTYPEKLKVTLMKFSAYGEEGKPAIQDRGPGDDYFDWVSFSSQTFDAPPNVWQTVHVTIQLPKTAAFGYYYAAAFSKAEAPAKAGARQNVLLGSTAVLMLVEAKVPNAKRTATVAGFSADKRVYEFLPASFKVRIHNGGNVHLVPTGNIFISRGKKTIATLGVNQARGNVLPNSNRVFTADWQDGFPVYTAKEAGGKVVLDNNNQSVKDLKWDFAKAAKLKFGRYTARLTMAYDNGKQDVPLEAVVSFWVIPWRLLAAGGLIVLFAGIGLWSSGRKTWQKLHKLRRR
jgi:hypothetical protein